MKNKNDSLGDRMKENYENRAKTYLIRRMPVIIRLDGRAFHTFVKGFNRPYDDIFHNAMNRTMQYLCENIQGCKLGYTQSDEITLLLTDYDTLTTDAWFNYNVQKICSISAAMATLKFNQFLQDESWKWIENYKESWHNSTEEEKYYNMLLHATEIGAMFDSRCFNVPKEEVCNCFIWRQQDATRNAIQMLGQCNFSDKELHKKSCSDIQDMLMTQKGINFNDMPIAFKRGICCIKKPFNMLDLKNYSGTINDVQVKENFKWVIDTEIPIFSQDRGYIEKWVEIQEKEA